jgi:serine/threonine-protein kinase
MAWVFGDGKWIYGLESENRCSMGGTAHVEINAQFPLPQPPHNPIPLLFGHGRENVTRASACPPATST